MGVRCLSPLVFVIFCPIGKKRKLPLCLSCLIILILGWEEGMFAFVLLILLRVFLYIFFSVVVDPSPSRESVFHELWRIKIPKKAKFFTWQVLLGHVNIIDRLLRNKFLLMGPSCCILYQKVKEDLDHILWRRGVSLHDLCGTVSSRVWPWISKRILGLDHSLLWVVYCIP